MLPLLGIVSMLYAGVQLIVVVVVVTVVGMPCGQDGGSLTCLLVQTYLSTSTNVLAD